MKSRFLPSVAAYFVTTMAIAYPWHMVLFHDKYLAWGAFTRGEPVMVLGITAVILQAVVFAVLLPLWLQQKPGNVIVNSVKFSLFLGLTVYSVMVFATAAKFQIEPLSQFILYGSVFQFLQFSFVGLVLGIVHRR